MNSMRLAYSYIRFSSPEQKKGDSYRRQLDDSETFCEDNHLVLDQTRHFFDPGKSAFKGKHRTEGALAAFLKLIESGRIPKGSVLIVEAFDRLSREETSVALQMFLRILQAGVDVVTLVDRQWYSQETINKNMGQLMMSIGAIWSANNFSVLLSGRLGKAWAQKQKLAIEEKRPMTSVCPGWLKLSKDGKQFELIPERVKIVRLVFWLTLRGWGKRRVSTFLNRHLDRVPTWGVKASKAAAWHYSYIQKILNNRAVLGECVPHTYADGKRKPVGGAIAGYFPAIVDETTFLKVQNLGTGPKGPLKDRALNLFQGLLRDGDYPKFSMWFKDHGDAKGKWIYVYSDYRRVHPDEPRFTWNYPALERLVLNYLVDLDWSALTTGGDHDVRQLAKALDGKDAHIAEQGRRIKKMMALAMAAGDVEEVAKEIMDLKSQRETLRSEAKIMRQQLAAKQDFSGDAASKLIKGLAAEREKVGGRKQLREAIRGQLGRIELFRTFPKRLLANLKLPKAKTGMKLEDFLHSRCVRIIFKNEAERWVVDRGDKNGYGLRFDGATLPPTERLEVNRDEMGGKVVLDASKSGELYASPVKAREFKARTKKK